MMKFLQNHPLLSIFLLALAVRLICLAVNPEVVVAPRYYDAGRYNGLAESILTGETYKFTGDLAQVSPGFPAFVAAIYLVTGHSYLWVLIAQCLLGALLAVLVALTARMISGQREGIVAGVAVALYWPLVTIGLQLLSETLFLVLLVASIYLLLSGMEKSDFRRLIFSAAVFALAALTRPVIMYFLVVVVAALLFHLRREKPVRRFITPAAYLTVVFLVMFPWAARNKAVLGEFVWTNTNTGQVLLTGNMPRYDKVFGFDLNKGTLGEENAVVLDLPELEKNSALKKMAIEHVLSHPEKLPGLLALKTAYFFSPFDWEMLGNRNGSFNPWFVWVLIFGVPGIFMVRWRWPHVLLPVLVLYFTTISMVTYASPRLRLPIIPILIITAAICWTRLENRIGSRLKSNALVTAIALSCIVSFAWSTPIKNAASSVLTSIGLW